MEPLTEHRQVSGPVVYGFQRLVRVSTARQPALTGLLVEYCRHHELRLSGVCSERATSAGPSSAAFTGLLDVLALSDVYGVVAPAMSHVGPKAIAAERERHIAAAGSCLPWIRRPRPQHPSASPGAPVRRRPAAIRALGTESRGPR
ncbi:hypothetical protein ABZ626_11820 [Streptomyces longispororuber]|uniref:hypothetical protein n=1 Tax=Streptomyces longispororuber TaxID=68230 RepID=UPI00340E510D